MFKRIQLNLVKTVKVCQRAKANRYSFSSKASSLLRKEDDFEVISMLGKGSTSRVYLGFDIVSQKKVVLKLFKT